MQFGGHQNREVKALNGFERDNPSEIDGSFERTNEFEREMDPQRPFF
jgi:hypothetical protein